jgi:hypothetical protein
MRVIAHLLLTFTFRRFWQRRPADQYALLVNDIGLSRAEEQAFLALRRSR